MKFLVILLITWIDGSQSSFGLPTSYKCEDAMTDAIINAHRLGYKYIDMECIYTDTIMVSPQPPNI